ncbi:replication factor-a protein [Rhizoclosmatium globosum]|uniref:Replication protein A subunit n=1 Tax=Rhizoclosmatium globosum TaxID=329046 RepID=A0A1Y2D032_9FUNG|nr:replication factor-a protein [Rhizoclosmatium globosum]|eukprot:ORY52620.1 replication factor-a protein [Rhizoclosmatium globosum]
MPAPPVLQILNVKKMAAATPDTPDRFRVIVSDGYHAMQGMLATQLNALVLNESITKHSILRCDKILANDVGGKRILILLDVTVLNPGDTTMERLGNPGTDIHGPPPPRQQPQQQAPPQQFYNQQPQQQTAQHHQPMQQQQQQQRPMQQQQQQSYQQQPQRQQQTHQASSSDVAVDDPCRVVNKSDIRNYNNAKGPGQLFSVVFGDDSGEIRATGFNDVVTQFYDLLQVNKVYYISKAQIKIANRQYSGGVNNDYEMTLDLASMITECNDGSAAPQIKYSRVMLNQLMEYEKDAQIAGKQLSKRDCTLADESGHSCRLTIWGTQAETSDGSSNPVYIMKGLRVNDFGGRSLSVSGGASLVEAVDCHDAHTVKGWWMEHGRQAGLVGYSGAGAEDNLGHNEKPDWLTLRVTIAFVKADRLWYPACQSADCQKKVVEGDSGWRCEKCQKSFPTPKYRYMMSCKTLDASGEQWISLFNDTAEALIGMTATELQVISESDNERFKAILDNILWKQVTVRVNCKMENYGDEGRLRVQAQSLEPINFASAAMDLADVIATFG